MDVCERGCEEMGREFWDEEIWVWMGDVFSVCICGCHLSLREYRACGRRAYERFGAGEGNGSVNVKHQVS